MNKKQNHHLVTSPCIRIRKVKIKEKHFPIKKRKNIISKTKNSSIEDINGKSYSKRALASSLPTHSPELRCRMTDKNIASVSQLYE